ncbi:Scr1 family TA system antitoxin-like transcriptional regulator [Lentzea sp. NPDC006480]
MLQTPAYMSAAIMASPTVPRAEVDARVKARLKMRSSFAAAG